MNRIGYILLSCTLAFASHCVIAPTPSEQTENVESEDTTGSLEPDIPLEAIQSIEIPRETKKIDKLQLVVGAEENDAITSLEELDMLEKEEPPVIDPNDVELLACVIYQEAGSDLQCDDCRRRVADVVLNRLESDLFPNTIYEVLTQDRQYGRFSITGVVWPERASTPNEASAVERAYRIAEEVLSGKHSELYGKNYVWQAEFTQGINIVHHCEIYFGQLDMEE